MPIDSSKFSSNSLTGTVKVTNGFANISIPTAFYALEGNVTFNVQVRTDSVSGAVIYSSPAVTLRDLSTFVSLTANTATVNEGDLVAFTLVTANALGNSTLYYSVFPVTANVTSSDFVANTGSFSLTNNAGTFTLKANTDLSIIDETGENFRVQLRTSSSAGNIVYTTSNIAIQDTSNTYNVLSFVGNSADTIPEGSNVTFTFTATNIPNGTLFYYSTAGNVTSFSSNTGSFALNGISNTFVISNPQVPFGATRTYNVVVRSGSTSGPIVATTNTINVIDDTLVFVSATGGIQSNISGYRIHTFTTSGNITFLNSGLIEYLIVAGGGGGGSISGGGGGAGGLLYTPSASIAVGSYPVVIGTGGTGSPSGAFQGVSGSNSSVFSQIAIGGGGGGSNGTKQGLDGGSGGGTSVYLSAPGGRGVYPGSPFISAPRQGYDGGAGTNSAAGGGGGAGGAGGQNTVSNGTLGGLGGGTGISYNITGSNITYAAGGQGWDTTNPIVNASNNTGTGGNGGSSLNGPGVGASGGSGVVIIRYNTNAAAFVNLTTPANFTYDGSNVVFTLSTRDLSNNTLLYYYTVGNILSSHFVTGNTGSFRTTQNSTTIRLPTNTTIPVSEERFFQLRITGDAGTSQDPLITSNVFTVKDGNLAPFGGEGGTLITGNGFNTHIFTTSGDITFTKPGTIEYLIVGGGGGGAYGGGTNTCGGGGGGAGGLIFSNNISVAGTTMSVVVGAAGTAGSYNARAPQGSPSSFNANTAIGGGGGGGMQNAGSGGVGAGNGGSGGGAMYGTAPGGGGTAGQGNPGGSEHPSVLRNSGGGGGAGDTGSPGSTTNGGIGLTTNLGLPASYGTTGPAPGRYFAGGGGGGHSQDPGQSTTGHLGGAGGGGNGRGASLSAGVTNTGGGGGGGGGASAGEGGGSGIVIIRYPV